VSGIDDTRPNLHFLTVQDSSIDDLVTHSLTQSDTFDVSINNDKNDYNDYNDYNDCNDLLTVDDN